ncbi:hypothetical protein [Enemella sp. A6]|uniref:hypothetical protein n=1 Tax=Enemella sp. A6 TaxID=3440152 RepID=UPI003EBEC407
MSRSATQDWIAASLQRMIERGHDYWPNMVLPSSPDSPILVVELLTQDIRLAIRQLTTANAIRRITPARLVVLIGPDPTWQKVVWEYYDPEELTRVAESYGADAVIDLGRAAADLPATGATLTAAGRTITIPDRAEMDAKIVDDLVDATVARLLKVPFVTDEIRSSEDFARIDEMTDRYVRIYEALFAREATAFITSHIDYHHWGAGVFAALTREVPILHVQATGSLKSYAWFPEMAQQTQLPEGAAYPTLRMHFTHQIAEFFENHIWANRDALRGAAELTVWRARNNFGRPSWWRGGGARSTLEYQSDAERHTIRQQAMRDLDMDPAKPVVAVFAHAHSDALKTNHEAFESLAHWFDATVAYAAEHPEVNWLIVDHPAQFIYDVTNHFEVLTQRYADKPHMVFRPSMDMSKSRLTSLPDLVLTVRGSVSNEYPAWGIPALQAGWSEWSHCGLSERADTQDEYWRKLEESIAALLRGAQVITDEQFERARLWMWAYRGITDVRSPLVPPWEFKKDNGLYDELTVTMGYVEAEGDSVMSAVRRLWRRRQALLTQVDFDQPVADLIEDLAPLGVDHLVEPRSAGFSTHFDIPVEPIPADERVTAGTTEGLMVMDGMVRGVGIISRIRNNYALLGFKAPRFDGPVRVSLDLCVDQASETETTKVRAWAARKARIQAGGDEDELVELPPLPPHRLVQITTRGREVALVALESRRTCRQQVEFILQPDEVDPDGLTLLEFYGLDANDLGIREYGLVGVRIDGITMTTAEEPSCPTQVTGTGRSERQTLITVMPGDDSARVQIGWAPGPSKPAPAPTAPVNPVPQPAPATAAEPAPEPAKPAVQRPAAERYTPAGAARFAKRNLRKARKKLRGARQRMWKARQQVTRTVVAQVTPPREPSAQVYRWVEGRLQPADPAKWSFSERKLTLAADSAPLVIAYDAGSTASSGVVTHDIAVASQ